MPRVLGSQRVYVLLQGNVSREEFPYSDLNLFLLLVDQVVHVSEVFVEPCDSEGVLRKHKDLRGVKFSVRILLSQQRRDDAFDYNLEGGFVFAEVRLDAILFEKGVLGRCCLEAFC